MILSQGQLTPAQLLTFSHFCVLPVKSNYLMPACMNRALCSNYNQGRELMLVHMITLICILSLPFVCLSDCPDGCSESLLHHSKCYLVVPTRKIWFEAEAYCRAQAPNAHLTSIVDAFELNNINAIVVNTPSISTCVQMWIGGNDFEKPATFVWTDGQPFVFEKWGGSQPDPRFMCVSSLARTTGEWQTEDCGDENCFICGYNNTASTAPPITSMTDCYDWLHIAGAKKSGIYTINLSGYDPFEVYCDMSTDGGGWTVFQKRQDDSVSFWNRTWSEYKNGFHNGLANNSWLGLDKIHLISSKDPNVVMRIDLHKNQCVNGLYCPSTSFDTNDYWYGEWDFRIGNETQKYQLNIGRATDGNLTSLDENDLFFGWSNYQAFSTIDRDNNGFGNGNCASSGGHYFGAWWYSGDNCGKFYLNGRYISSPLWGPSGMGVYRTHFVKDYWINPVQSEMKLRKKV